MKENYRPDLKAHVLTDDANRVRAIRHSQEYWESPVPGGLTTATRYLRDFASVYEIPSTRFDRLETQVSYLAPREQGEEYRLSHEKRMFDSETFGFYQTYLNVPVWHAGLKVSVKQGPNRVVRSVDTTQLGVNATLPPPQVLKKFQNLFGESTAASISHRAVRAQTDLRAAGVMAAAGEAGEAGEAEADGANYIRSVLKFASEGEDKIKTGVRMIRGRFWIYRYDASVRLPDGGVPDQPEIYEQEAKPKRRRRGGGEVHIDVPLPFDVPPVDDKIEDGAYYMVGEVTFEVTKGDDKTVWQMLIELQTNSILYLRPMVAYVNGCVFEEDPITKSGIAESDPTTGTVVPNSTASNATLNEYRDDVELQNLDAPDNGTQHLSGTFVEVTQVAGLDIPPPTQAVAPDGSTPDFCYDVRTNDFASVSGYFHVDRIFRTMQDLGFNLATYMSNTYPNFPIPVDTRAMNSINAYAMSDGMGGIGEVGFGLMEPGVDLSDATDRLGRACDPRVHLHEVLGHGILYEAVGYGNMGFVHSAGDSLSFIYFDPDSQCKGVDGTPLGKPGDLRFTYVPWHPTLDRRADRDVASGWAWNGSRDDGDYGSEQILSTTLFRFYRSIGGDHPNLGRRQFASRMAMYLIIRAIGDLTPATDPQYARDFAEDLWEADAHDWTSEGVSGGAYKKVIRWAFEKQGEYQTPLVTTGSSADGTITTEGDPEEMDVYIDDGRAGEYEFQRVHWETTTIWNRRAADGIEAHQEPELGSTNYAYVKIKNRGTSQATNVVVYGYHTKPGAGLNWPGDFEAFSTASINAGTLNSNNTEEKIIGPFEWTPNLNTYGHDCMLMVVTADGDESNVDNLTAGQTIPEWRLVPNDNNVGQRNVFPVPGGDGEAGLMAGLDGVSFFVGNPNPQRGKMTFDITLPTMLVRRGWGVELVGVGDGFTLTSGAKREVFIKLHPGKPFTRDAVEASTDRDVRIDVLHNDNLIGGMTYRLDPDISQPWNIDRPKKHDCLDEAQLLAECLGIDQEIGKVCVKEIIVGLKVKKDDCC